MIKSLISLTLITFLFINCGSESKANPVNKTSNSVKNVTNINSPLKTDSNNNTINIERVSLNKTDIKEIKNTDDFILDNDNVKKVIIEQENESDKIDLSNIENIETLLNDKYKFSSTPSEQVKENNVSSINFNHQKFDELLKKHVTSSGKVNYKGIKSESGKLETYIKELQTEYANLNSWSRNKQLAFWINVYNAHTIQLIINNYPLSSITTLKAGKPWDYKFIKLGDDTFTLNDVENTIIRPKYNEPRIHFAVNCAAKSCPKLMNKAWTEDNLNSALTTQTKAFLANTTENTIGVNKVKLSKIFEWYNADFIKSGSLISFIKKYSAASINDDAKVTYNEYNWDLNE
jgi:hypothetical protein